MDDPWRVGMLIAVALWSFGAGQDARAEPARLLEKKTAAATCNRAQFRTIVDVGHSSEDPGAISARGVPEYEFNLRLAKRIEEKLVTAGFDRTTLLITPGRARHGLAHRVAYAAHTPADLFLSVHHDAIPKSFLQPWEHEGQTRHYSDFYRGHSIFISYDNIARKASQLFARLLGMQLKEQGLQYTQHYTQKIMGRRQRELIDAEAGVYRYDQLVVLRSTPMPAVLLEAGSIVNREEELLLGTPEHQTRISTAVAGAVENFCAALSKPQIARRP